MRLAKTVAALCKRHAQTLQKNPEPEAPATWHGRLARRFFILLATLTLPATAQIDMSGNGMSDVWERHFNNGNLFDPENPAHHPDADPDGDGWTNLEESIAGTDPFSGSPPEGMVVTHVTHLPNQPAVEGGIADVAIISWDTLPGKEYTLFCSPDLTGESWIAIDTPYAGDGTPAAITITLTDSEGVSPDKLFWRVHVHDPHTDTDSDGLTDYEEYLLGSNPYNADTSGDGVPDGWLVVHGYNPNDHHENILFGDSDVTVPDAYNLGVQNHPHATVEDLDGDGVPNILDADPNDREINWEKSPETRYVWIEQVDEVDPVYHKHQPLALNKHGQILFRDTRSYYGLDQSTDPKNLWNSASREWVVLPLRGSQEIDVLQNTNDWHYDIDGTPTVLPEGQHVFNFNAPAYELIDINDEGVIYGVSLGVTDLYIDLLIPGMTWKRTGSSLTEYTLPSYFYPQYPFPAAGGQSIVNRSPIVLRTEGAIANDGTINSFAFHHTAGFEWMTYDSTAFDSATPASAAMRSVKSTSGGVFTFPTYPGGILDKDRALFVEAAGSQQAPFHKLWLKEEETQTDLSFMAAGQVDLAELSLVPNLKEDDQDRLWITTGDKVFIEKHGGSGEARWHKPPSMAEGAIRLNASGVAITSTKLWRNAKYTDINELTEKPEGVTITQVIDLASNGIILATSMDDGVAKTGLLVPFHVGLVEIDADGSLVGQPTPFVEPNLSAPVFEFAPPELGAVSYDEDGMTTLLSLTGQVRSDGCDAVRGEMGVIDQVRVTAPAIGGYEDDEITLSTTVQKAQARVGNGPFAFPFIGDFTLPATSISITEGTNTFEIEATDPVSGETGKSTFAFDARPVMQDENLPLLASGGITLVVEPSQEPTTSGTATLTIHPENGAPYVWQLTESTPGGGLYVTPDETVAIELDLDAAGPVTALFSHTTWEVEDFAIPAREVAGGYQGGFTASTIQVAQGVDPPDYTQLLLTEPELVAETGPGEARAYALRLEGFDHLDDAQLEEISASWSMDSETEFGFFRDPGSGAILIADPEAEDVPLTVLPRLTEENLDPNPGASIHSERLDKWVGGSPAALQFSSGLLYGFGQGGYDLVTALGTLWVGAVTFGGEELSQGLNYIELGFANLFGSANHKAQVRLQIELAQNDLQARREMMATIATACYEITQWIQEANHDLLATLVLRPVNAELADFHGERLGEKSQMVMDIAANLAESATDAWANAPSYDKGRYTGILIFEVASCFVTVSKLGKLTKADVLVEFANRNLNIPGGPAMKARAATFADDLTTTKMCFVAGTLVLVQVNGVEALLPIETLEPLARDGAKINAWAKCEHTGVEDWRPIVAYFTTHPEELFDLTIDTSGDGQADETLTGTGEHPFWVEEFAVFMPMRDLAPGMRLTTARSTGLATIVGNTSKRGPPGEQLTTYNFEVAGFHTYFVGNSAVWVHNTGRAACERVFSIFSRYMKKHGDNFQQSWESVLRMLPRMELDLRHTAYLDAIKTHNPGILAELAASGVNHTADSIVAIGRRSDGKIIFMERGNDAAGFTHILRRHGSEFKRKGVPDSRIPDLVHKAATEGVEIGIQGTRPIYRTTFMDEVYDVAVTVGDNGFIVGANIR